MISETSNPANSSRDDTRSYQYLNICSSYTSQVRSLKIELYNKTTPWNCIIFSHNPGQWFTLFGKLNTIMFTLELLHIVSWYHDISATYQVGLIMPLQYLVLYIISDSKTSEFHRILFWVCLSSRQHYACHLAISSHYIYSHHLLPFGKHPHPAWGGTHVNIWTSWTLVNHNNVQFSATSYTLWPTTKIEASPTQERLRKIGISIIIRHIPHQRDRCFTVLS